MPALESEHPPGEIFLVDLTHRTHSPSTLQCLNALLHRRNAAWTHRLPAARGGERGQWIPEADQDLASLADKHRMLRLALGAVSTASD